VSELLCLLEAARQQCRMMRRKEQSLPGLENTDKGSDKEMFSLFQQVPVEKIGYAGDHFLSR
jgi:hypothetical protein